MTTTIKILTDDFDVGAELASLSAAAGDLGAVASFTGYVRGDDGLVSLTLETYPAMATREIERHLAQAQGKWPLLGATIVHRYGRLEPGARIVLVAVASRHRGSAFEACQFLIDYLKVHAPFWKQEERAGQAAWVEARRSDEDAAARW